MELYRHSWISALFLSCLLLRYSLKQKYPTTSSTTEDDRMWGYDYMNVIRRRAYLAVMSYWLKSTFANEKVLEQDLVTGVHSSRLALSSQTILRLQSYSLERSTSGIFDSAARTFTSRKYSTSYLERVSIMYQEVRLPLQVSVSYSDLLYRAGDKRATSLYYGNWTRSGNSISTCILFPNLYLHDKIHVKCILVHVHFKSDTDAMDLRERISRKG